MLLVGDDSFPWTFVLKWYQNIYWVLHILVTSNWYEDLLCHSFNECTHRIVWLEIELQRAITCISKLTEWAALREAALCASGRHVHALHGTLSIHHALSVPSHGTSLTFNPCSRMLVIQVETVKSCDPRWSCWSALDRTMARWSLLGSNDYISTALRTPTLIFIFIFSFSFIERYEHTANGSKIDWDKYRGSRHMYRESRRWGVYASDAAQAIVVSLISRYRKMAQTISSIWIRAGFLQII